MCPAPNDSSGDSRRRSASETTICRCAAVRGEAAYRQRLVKGPRCGSGTGACCGSATGRMDPARSVSSRRRAASTTMTAAGSSRRGGHVECRAGRCRDDEPARRAQDMVLGRAGRGAPAGGRSSAFAPAVPARGSRGPGPPQHAGYAAGEAQRQRRRVVAGHSPWCTTCSARARSRCRATGSSGRASEAMNTPGLRRVIRPDARAVETCRRRTDGWLAGRRMTEPRVTRSLPCSGHPAPTRPSPAEPRVGRVIVTHRT